MKTSKDTRAAINAALNGAASFAKAMEAIGEIANKVAKDMVEAASKFSKRSKVIADK